MNSGDLGASSFSEVQGLVGALYLATAWNAVILIDKADVFLEQRSAHDLERNSLVSGTIALRPPHSEQ